MRPTVQGTVVVLENKTGRILAMAGGFSYPLSQLNRATQSVRQPGSTIKPLSYLAALGKGLQPNTLIADEPITLPPIGGRRAREQDYWTPKNYDGGAGGISLCAVRWRTRAISQPYICSTAASRISRKQASIGFASLRWKPRFITNACAIIRSCSAPSRYGRSILRPSMQQSRMKGCARYPMSSNSIERDGPIVYRHDPDSVATIGSVDRAAFYQLKSMMQGVLARGTARSIADLAPYVAGKTGTSDDENDAWFVGFTNEVTVAVWLGYDNADGKRRTLGGGATGGGVAVPIFEPVIKAVWANVAPRTALAPPSPRGQTSARLQIHRPRLR